MTSYKGQASGGALFDDAAARMQMNARESLFVYSLGPSRISFDQDYNHLPPVLELKRLDWNQIEGRDYGPRDNNIDGVVSSIIQNPSTQFNLVEPSSQWHSNDYLMEDSTKIQNFQNSWNLTSLAKMGFIHQSMQGPHTITPLDSSSYPIMLQGFLTLDPDHPYWSTAVPNYIVHDTSPLGSHIDDQGAYIDQFNASHDIQTILAPQAMQQTEERTQHADLFSCTQLGCLVTFKRVSDRIRHEATIHGVNHVYLCPINGCVKSYGKGYSRKDKLTEHLWKEHANLGFVKRV